MFGCTKADTPDLHKVDGPKELLQKLKSAKGVTMKRMSIKPNNNNRTEREKKEEKRHMLVKREAKRIDCLSSDMNACQAVVKPDCSKPKVVKSSGMRKALIQALTECVTQASGLLGEEILEERNIVFLSKKTVPKQLIDSVAVATIEFAGVKFKTQSTSGSQYLKYVENGVIMRTKIQFPNLRQLAICEEKYHFTPDDFKAATRSQRQKAKQFNITHLKTTNEILTMDKFDKNSIVTTNEGKHLISTYLARNIDKLNIPTNLMVDIDSELNITACHCDETQCQCNRFTSPIRAVFPKQDVPNVEILAHIQQKKGEAEMAQIDWLLEYKDLLQCNESCASIVSSGDIDSVVLHLFAIAYLWPRHENQRRFINDVYVILQKPGGLLDIYNITAILSLLELVYQDRHIGQKLALVLSLGGNDYLPKFHGISHQVTIKTFLQNQYLLSKLFDIKDRDSGDMLTVHFDVDLYKSFIKTLYCSKTVDPEGFTYAEIRQLTIQAKPNGVIKSPQSWMPPETAIEQLAKNVKCLIAYYLTVGRHSTQMLDFLKDGCLIKTKDGDIEYDLGPHAHIHNIEHCLIADPDILQEKLRCFRVKQHKRKSENTPQKGRRRKVRPMTSTPRK